MRPSKRKILPPEYEVSPIMHDIEIDPKILENQLKYNNNPYRFEILRKARVKEDLT